MIQYRWKDKEEEAKIEKQEMKTKKKVWELNTNPLLVKIILNETMIMIIRSKSI